MARIVVAGAGSIGCFVGGMLARAGRDVTFLARPRVAAAIRTNGLHLTAFTGLDARLDSNTLRIETDPAAALRDADIVLVTVKTGDTVAMARLLADHAPPSAVVVSLQNGVSTDAVLRGWLPGRDVRAGMVPFNVVAKATAHLHRASSGRIVIAPGPGDLPATLAVPGLRLVESADIDRLKWGKLLLNLTNALNALSGLPLRRQMQDRRWRRVMADQFAEALAVLRAEGLRPRMSPPFPARLVPWILRLPGPVFRRLAARLLTIDPEARTSMWADLEMRRTTEIGELQGVILDMAARHGLPAPINTRAAQLIAEAEAAGLGSPGLPPEALRDRS